MAAPRIAANKVTSRYTAPKKAPSRAVTPSALLRPVPQTAQQWADAQAQKIVDEQIKTIRDQQAAYNQTLQQQAAQQAADAQRFAQMVQALGIDKQIAGIYGSAGRDIAGMAQGFAGNIRDTAAADAAAQTRMVSGTGQEGAVRNEGTGMGDVVYGVGGYIPGKTMGEAGAALASDAARAPGFMLEQRVGEAQKALNEGLQSSSQDFLDAILKATASKSDVSSQLYKQRVDLNTTEQKMRLQQFNDDRNYWLKMQAYYQSIGKLKLSKDAAARAASAEKRYAYESMGRDAEGNVAPGYIQMPDGTIMKRSDWLRQQKDKGLDASGNLLPGYVRKNGKVVKTATAKKGAAALTPNAKASILQGVLNQETDMTKKMPSIAAAAGYDALLTRMGPPSPKQQKQLTTVRAAIAKELWSRYAPRAVTPESKKALRAMIARVIRDYTPGAGSGSLTAGLLP